MDPDKFAALEHVAAQVDAEAPPTADEMAQQARQAQQQEQQQQETSQAEAAANDWAAIPYALGHALAMLAPKARAIYTEQACLQWGRAMVPVAAKYGWNGVGNVPELGLILVTLGLAVPTVFVVREAVAEERGGVLGKLRAWWLEKRAARAARKAGRPVPEPGGVPRSEGASGGG